METGVIFYEFEDPYVYEDPVHHSYFIMGLEPRIRQYALPNRAFQHPLSSLHFDPDALYDFPLSWLHPDAPGHPFPDDPEHPIPAQPLNEAVPEPIIPDEPELADDYVPVIPPEWDFPPEPIPDFPQPDEPALPDGGVAPIYANGPVLANGFVHSDSSISGGSEDIVAAVDDKEEEDPEIEIEQDEEMDEPHGDSPNGHV
ncbi:uncharacterized protein DS421_19g656260 [Arachis hypogaea]|uniref:Uncharacterized protein n=1 Tax=Arachis hypogaea TaxID=3818 RepID=A0A6B9V8Z8_ARAHY|nr:uncharacterized protein DS421_19g656260 [Arachis hypogaea]